MPLAALRRYLPVVEKVVEAAESVNMSEGKFESSARPLNLQGDTTPLTRPTSSLKCVKTEQSPGRLPSLRGPRDLTLGGIKKKTFAPNIPVRKDRNKQDTKDDVPMVKVEKRPRSRDGRQRGRGRGGRARGAKVIQSHSIFEARPDISSAGRGGGRQPTYENATSQQLQKPTIKKETVDTALEQAASKAAMERLEKAGHAFIADLQNDENLAPVSLPLQQKQREDIGALDAFGDMYNGLALLHLPDSLPGFAPTDDLAAQSQLETTNSDTVSQPNRCPIDALPEGKIGKLQVFKSGRCRMLIKGVPLDLWPGTPASFVQEVVSVRLPPEGSPEGLSGHVSVLGEVSHKVVCVPDLAALAHS